MGRPISQTLQELLDSDSCETQSTLELRLLSGDVLRCATAEITAGGQNFTDDLRKTGEIIQSAFSNVDRTNSQIQNVDKEIGRRILSGSIDRAEAIVGRLYRSESNPSKTEWVELFRGEAKPTEINSSEATMEIVDDLVAAGYCVADQSFETACPLRFKGFRCGYTGDAPPCSHNLETCRILHRFAGMETRIETVSTTPGDSGGGLGGGGDSGGERCFVAGTLIDTPDGRRAIEDIKPGSACVSFNPSTFAIEPDSVIETFQSEASGCFELDFGGGKQVKVTGKHRFLTGRGKFARAANLRIGQLVYVKHGEKLVEALLEKRKWTPGKVTVYNFHVRANHTYFANGFAVHNRKEDYDLFPTYQY